MYQTHFGPLKTTEQNSRLYIQHSTINITWTLGWKNKNKILQTLEYIRTNYVIKKKTTMIN